MKFEKISFEQYTKDKVDYDYDSVKLPQRATKNSAGYDIFSVKDFTLYPGHNVLLPTGIKVKLDPYKFLMIVPRSGMGFRYGVRLANGTGIVDADYYNNKNNEGHIWVKLDYPVSYINSDPIVVKKGDSICQGIITQYFKVENDTCEVEREGGFGSTSVRCP